MLLQPKPPKFDEWAIRAELRRRGWTFSKLAKESGLDAKSFSAAFKKPSLKFNTYMAKVLGIPVHELWPYWFDADGDLIPAKYRRKLSRQRQTLASHESAAA
jgi:lambda repressor-like predicted transcriptional regulator